MKKYKYEIIGGMSALLLIVTIALSAILYYKIFAEPPRQSPLRVSIGDYVDGGWYSSSEPKARVIHFRTDQDCIWNDAGEGYRCFYLDDLGMKVFEPMCRGARCLVKPYDSPEVR
jgi:hypothetical protein